MTKQERIDAIFQVIAKHGREIVDGVERVMFLNELAAQVESYARGADDVLNYDPEDED